jgi:CheY-like chemotaxis protein
LRRRGFEIHLVEDGNFAIAEALSIQPDVILMDLSVVTSDCWKTATELKAIPQTANIPIVALSVLDLTWDQEVALQAGCDVYLPKPVDMDMLAGVLFRVSNAKCVPAEPE